MHIDQFREEKKIQWSILASRRPCTYGKEQIVVKME